MSEKERLCLEIARGMNVLVRKARRAGMRVDPMVGSTKPGGFSFRIAYDPEKDTARKRRAAKEGA